MKVQEVKTEGRRLISSFLQGRFTMFHKADICAYSLA